MFASLAVAIAFLYERVMEDRERAIRLGALHEVLGLAAVFFFIVHGLLLLGDTFLKPNFADIVIPFALSYKRADIGFGIVGGYVMAVLAGLYYIRNKIGPAVFKQVHRFTVVGWVLAVFHTFGAGTDYKSTWYRIVLLPFILSVPATFVARLLRRRRPTVAGMAREGSRGA